ncbi:hypothetical protein [uncultured Eudoraea sp.]|uniref:tetratricopeptide repeat protein n=1 Tax=uncultured Eudoraea sp. TaxID=1035614 RepID=UPI00261920DA|nr:hypothetical protein [uncultured Eudoraea sp.]
MKKADSLYTIGFYSEAINLYAKVNSQSASIQIARSYNAIGSYNKAILQYSDIISKNDASQIAKFELAKLFLKLKKFSNAVVLFSDLTLDQASNPEYNFYLGMAQLGLDDSKKGIRSFKTAFLKDSTHLRSIFQLSKYYLAQNFPDSVLFYVSKGLRYYPDDVSLINLNALALYNDNDFENAIPLFERLIDMGESQPYIIEKLAFSYFKTWKLPEAKQNYFLLLNYDQAIREALNGLGNTYWREKKLDSAAYYFKKSITEQKPNLLNEYTALAQLAREQDKLELAMNYYKKAYLEDAGNSHVYYQICVLADQLYKNPKIKLEYYQNFLEKFGMQRTYYSEFARKRVAELKEEIHFAVD